MGCLCHYEKENQKNGSKGNKTNKTNNKDNKKTKEDKIVFKSIDITKKRKNKIDTKKLENLINKEKEKFNNRALQHNNKYRKKHGVDPLVLDDNLYKRAFIVAKQYLTEGTFDNTNLLYEAGEELGMNTLSSEKELNPKQLMKEWYDEIKNIFEKI
jgi:uncharacterized protein YkwD